MRVQVQSGIANRVDAAQVYLKFDPEYLTATDLSGGKMLEYPLQQEVDNGAGRVAYAAGTLEGWVYWPFTLTTVTFRAVAPTGGRGTYVGFDSLKPPRQTKAVFGGANVTGELTGANVVVR